MKCLNRAPISSTKTGITACADNHCIETKSDGSQQCLQIVLSTSSVYVAKDPVSQICLKVGETSSFLANQTLCAAGFCLFTDPGTGL